MWLSWSGLAIFQELHVYSWPVTGCRQRKGNRTIKAHNILLSMRQTPARIKSHTDWPAGKSGVLFGGPMAPSTRSWAMASHDLNPSLWHRALSSSINPKRYLPG
ncbi:uncharacterized protein BDW70DRAFT_142472 [Aspergillus foveolatus]|uniref:uncharacterized protein n=1 Tax=Aspergillus foveolatus TaxID=210207 RepID=UPI003CCD6C21